MLHPLKFAPIPKERIWGGNKLHTSLNKPFYSELIGESWELSALPGDESVVVNGPLAGKTINELLHIYKGELVGDKVFQKFEYQFPLLFKLLDANDNLSIQVHPNDAIALERHQSFGKTEMWYILEAEEGAEIVVGFNREVDKEIYLKHLNEGTLESILNKVKVKVGDVYFIPAGLVHAIGKGILLAEIQQSSDITYRLFDYNRVDSKGNTRELHTSEALDAINFNNILSHKIDYVSVENGSVELVCSEFFTVNLIDVNDSITRDLSNVDSFVIYMCIAGHASLTLNENSLDLYKGDLVLVPSAFGVIDFEIQAESQFLEIYSL